MKQCAHQAGGNGGREASIDVPDQEEPGVRAQAPARDDAGTLPALERMRESLVFAYLATNTDIKNLPLKSFLDNFEKNILLACLRLTRGNQRDAAALLSLKPTALFEKMRKHGIRSQRGRLPGESWEMPADNSRN